MDGTILPPSISGAQLDSMRELASRDSASPFEGKAAEQLESMFASLLIKSLRQSVGGEGFFPGDKADALGSLFDQYLGEEIAKGRGLGLAKALEKYDRNSQEPSP